MVGVGPAVRFERATPCPRRRPERLREPPLHEGRRRAMVHRVISSRGIREIGSENPSVFGLCRRVFVASPGL
eukprot:4542785-Lingulodinium_polyedra.AAC.1